jgi:hypothetical protein
MKNLIKYMCLSLSFGMLLTSCDDNDEYTGGSVLEYNSQAITVTSSEASYTFNEADIDEDEPSTYTVTLSASIPEAASVDAFVTFSQTDGTSDGNDYSVGSIKIPAGSTTGSTAVEVNYTGDIEGSESFTLMANTNGNFTMASDFSVTINIEDKVNDVLKFSTTWAGSKTVNLIGVAGAELDFCTIDIDVLLFDSSGAQIGYLGATSSCTEEGSMSDVPDGEYYVVLDVFENDLAVYELTDTVPVTITYNQENFISGSIINTEINMSSPTGLTTVAIVTKSGYNYTVVPF